MARSLCSRCQRPLTHCWCACIHPVTSSVSIGVLQHPSETKIVKSSLPLLRACMTELELWQGETIAAAAAVTPTRTSLRAWLENGRQTYLLYPPTPELSLPPVCPIERLREASFGAYQILLLDGTWRKAYKMLCANPELQALPRVALVSEQSCAYFIRKQKHPAGLSTLEAVAEVLQQLQPESVIRAPLKQAFLCFQKGLFTPESRTGGGE